MITFSAIDKEFLQKSTNIFSVKLSDRKYFSIRKIGFDYWLILCQKKKSTNGKCYYASTVFYINSNSQIRLTETEDNPKEDQKILRRFFRQS